MGIMYQVATQLAHMPIQLVCLSNGLIAFARTHQFSTIWESNEDYQVCIDSDGIEFVSESLAEPLDIPYNAMIEYKDKPVLIKWLQSMQLQQHTF